MDVWMLGCISFLFFSLAELAVVSYILRNDKPRREPRRPKGSNRSTCDGPKANGTSGGPAPQPRKLPYASINGHLHAMVVYDERYVDLAYKADRICLLGFPPLFITFNIIYWIYYIS